MDINYLIKQTSYYDEIITTILKKKKIYDFLIREIDEGRFTLETYSKALEQKYFDKFLCNLPDGYEEVKTEDIYKLYSLPDIEVNLPDHPPVLERNVSVRFDILRSNVQKDFLTLSTNPLFKNFMLTHINILFASIFSSPNFRGCIRDKEEYNIPVYNPHNYCMYLSGGSAYNIYDMYLRNIYDYDYDINTYIPRTDDYDITISINSDIGLSSSIIVGNSGIENKIIRFAYEFNRAIIASPFNDNFVVPEAVDIQSITGIILPRAAVSLYGLKGAKVILSVVEFWSNYNYSISLKFSNGHESIVLSIIEIIVTKEDIAFNKINKIKMIELNSSRVFVPDIESLIKSQLYAFKNKGLEITYDPIKKQKSKEKCVKNYSRLQYLFNIIYVPYTLNNILFKSAFLKLSDSEQIVKFAEIHDGENLLPEYYSYIQSLKDEFYRFLDINEHNIEILFYLFIYIARIVNLCIFPFIETMPILRNKLDDISDIIQQMIYTEINPDFINKITTILTSIMIIHIKYVPVHIKIALQTKIKQPRITIYETEYQRIKDELDAIPDIPENKEQRTRLNELKIKNNAELLQFKREDIIPGDAAMKGLIDDELSKTITNLALVNDFINSTFEKKYLKSGQKNDFYKKYLKYKNRYIQLKKMVKK
jgi:hypothetical protein